MQVDHSAVISERAISLEKALRREKALAEVPRIISRSRGDIDAVLTAWRSASLSPSHAPFETPRTYGSLSHRGEARGVLGHFLKRNRMRELRGTNDAIDDAGQRSCVYIVLSDDLRRNTQLGEGFSLIIAPDTQFLGFEIRKRPDRIFATEERSFQKQQRHEDGRDDVRPKCSSIISPGFAEFQSQASIAAMVGNWFNTRR
jgi:hypothetical protein